MLGTLFGRISLWVPALKERVEHRANASSPGGRLILPLLIFAVGSLAVLGTARAQSGTVGYVYDQLGRLSVLYDSSGNAAVYNYDGVGNLLSITSDAANQFSITNLNQTSGSVGATVAIYGTDFQSCTTLSVTFNGVAATTVQVVSSTEILATVPANATTGSVVVTCNGVQKTAGTYTVGSFAPTITGFTPTIGTAGTAVTISGTNFQTTAANDAVRFGIAPQLPTSATATAINATVPGAARTGYLSVTTPQGQAVSTGYFFVPPAPATVSSIAVAEQITIGGPGVTVTTSTAGTQALLAFDGAAGTPISLNLTKIGYAPSNTVTIYNPDGTTLATAEFDWNQGQGVMLTAPALPMTGTYTVFIDPGSKNTGSVTLQLYNTSDVTGTLTIGGPPLAVATNPGQDARLTFSGTAGTPISLSLTNVGYPPSNTVTIYNPDGSTLGSTEFDWNGGSSAILADLTLPTTGTYTVLVDPGSNNAGGVTLQLYNATDVTGTLTIGGPAVTVTTEPGQDARLTFSGTAGTPISLSLTNIGYPPPSNTATIYNPNGSTLASTGFDWNRGSSAILADLVLPATGTYTVFIDPAGTNTGSVTLQLYNTADVTGTLVVGGPPETVTTSYPGQDARLTFAGSAGTWISLSLSNIGYPPSNTVTIYNPDGSALGSTEFDSNGGSNWILGNLQLPTTGTYTVFVDPGGINTGSVTLQLWNLGDISSTVNTSDTYAQTILADSPQMYWRLDESAPGTAASAAPALKYGVAGPTSPDTAISLNGYSSYVSTSKQFTSPTTYSAEIWFKTTTSIGGKLIGFGSSRTGASSSYDRHLYITSSGRLILGQYSGSIVTVTSPSSYNDGFWHYAVGTFDGSTMTLYVDGSSVGSASSGAPQNYAGYWRLGYDNLNGWPSAPASYYFQGSIGEAAVYSSALSAAQVSNHYAAAGAGNYDSTVLADSPTSYWKLSESSGPNLADATGGGNGATAIAESNNGLYIGGVTYGQTGAIAADNAVTFDGSSGYFTTPFSFTNPQQFSLEVWFKTTTARGGKLIGFGNSQMGWSGYYDRHIYMTNSGQIIFGTYDGSGPHTVESANSYNDGNWHQVVGTWSNNTLSLYIDGALIGTTSGGVQNYSGYWRLGADGLGGWPSTPSSFNFGGSLDEAAIYNYALNATQVANHYHASGR